MAAAAKSSAAQCLERGCPAKHSGSQPCWHSMMRRLELPRSIVLVADLLGEEMPRVSIVLARPLVLFSLSLLLVLWVLMCKAVF